MLLFALLSRLDKSLHKVSLQVISKLTMQRFIFPNSTYDQNKYCTLLTVILLVARPKFVVVLQAILSGGLPRRLPQIVLLWVCRTSFNISPSVVLSSAV